MIVTLFVAASNGQSSKPGSANRQISLQAVKAPAPTPAVAATATTTAVPASTPAGPNDSLFDTPANGTVTLSFNGVNAATKAFFEEGAEYLVTIEKAPSAS